MKSLFYLGSYADFEVYKTPMPAAHILQTHSNAFTTILTWSFKVQNIKTYTEISPVI